MQILNTDDIQSTAGSQAFSPEKTLEIPYNNELTLRNKNKGNDIQQGKHFLPLAWTQWAISKKYY